MDQLIFLHVYIVVLSISLIDKTLEKGYYLLMLRFQRAAFNKHFAVNALLKFEVNVLYSS